MEGGHVATLGRAPDGVKWQRRDERLVYVHHVELLLAHEGPHAPGRYEQPDPVVRAIGREVGHAGENHDAQIAQLSAGRTNDGHVIAALAKHARQLEGVVLDPTFLAQIVRDDLADLERTLHEPERAGGPPVEGGFIPNS